MDDPGSLVSSCPLRPDFFELFLERTSPGSSRGSLDSFDGAGTKRASCPLQVLRFVGLQSGCSLVEGTLFILG